MGNKTVMAPGRGKEGAVTFAVSESYGVRVSSAVVASADWKARVARAGRFRTPRGWRWDVKLAERASALEGTRELLLVGCYADVAFANSLEEVCWARDFVRRVEVEAWCFDLSIFDARALSGVPMPVSRWAVRIPVRRGNGVEMRGVGATSISALSAAPSAKGTCSRVKP